jgi:DNA-binding transcriptional MocR family regulator
MLYVPGEFSYAAEGIPAKGNTIRLSFGVQSPERIELGIAALAKAIQEAQQGIPRILNPES